MQHEWGLLQNLEMHLISWNYVLESGANYIQKILFKKHKWQNYGKQIILHKINTKITIF